MQVTVYALAFCILGCAAGAASLAQASVAWFAVDGPGIVNAPQDIRAGKLVQSPGGKVIGTVKAVVAKPHRGGAKYALIATDSGIVAIPWWEISYMLRDGHIVIDPQLLAFAPRIRKDQVHGATNSDWKKQANDYWRGWR